MIPVRSGVYAQKKQRRARLGAGPTMNAQIGIKIPGHEDGRCANSDDASWPSDGSESRQFPVRGP